MKIRTISWLAIGLLCAASIIACGDQDTSIDATQTTGLVSETQSQEESTGYSADYLPDADYDGYSFRIAAYEEYPLHMEEESGNMIDDAIFKRNQLAEEKFNIDINETRYTYASGNYQKVYDLLNASALAGSDDYDLYFLVFPHAYQALIKGFIPPAYSLNYTDPTMPWYCKSLNDSLVVDGLQLLTYTAFDKNPGGQGLVFNKRILNDRDIESPYSMVKNGTWTYDIFYELIKMAGEDLNGNGTADNDDQFGFIDSTAGFTDFAYYGSGLKLVDFTSGTPVVNQSETLVDMFTKAVEATSDTFAFLDTSKFFKNSGTVDSEQLGIEFFIEGKALFLHAYVSTLVKLGDMSDDYGIVPFPKWTAEQENYYCSIDGSRISVPSTASKDLDRVCIIKEYLSAESLNINYPAYYEVSLKNRYVRDEESIEMLDIITNATTYDMGCAMDYEAIRSPWQNCLSKRSTDFVSAVSKNLKKANRVITELMKNVEMLKEMYE